MAAALVVALLAAHGAHAKWEHGRRVVSAGSDFVFATRFACDTMHVDGAYCEMQLSDLTVDDPDNVMVNFYFDSQHAGGWAAIYDGRLSCTERLALAQRSVSLREFRDVNQLRQSFTQTARPHYWFVTFARCNRPGFEVTFDAHWVQGRPTSDPWRELSADAQGLMSTYIVFSLAFIALVALNATETVLLVRKRAYHPIVRILSLALLLNLLSVFFKTVHWGAYAANGAGLPFMDGFGDAFDFLAEVVFMFLLVLLAQGWAITQHTIDFRVPMAAGAAAFMLLYVAVFVWHEFGVDPATSTFFYATPPGIVVLILRAAVMIFFGVLLGRTLRKEGARDKRTFYLLLGAAFTLYFLSLPIIATLSAVAPLYMREKLTISIYLVVKALAYTAMALLLWPRWSAKFFTITAPDLLVGGGGGASPGSGGGYGAI